MVVFLPGSVLILKPCEMGKPCPECNSSALKLETDVLDVWMDSGLSHALVMGDGVQSDLYLEGSDQYRGWFNSSLVTSVALYDQAPYKKVLTHGFVLDGKGNKMSKSKGNVIEPQKIIQKHGADVLRLWVSSVDFREDVRISNDMMTQVAESYRKLRNTIKFILGAVTPAFEADRAFENMESFPLLERWVLSRMQELSKSTKKAYEDFRFSRVVTDLHQFTVSELSAFYLDVSKDHLYCEPDSSDHFKMAEATSYIIGREMILLLAPILSFTTDEAWQLLPKMKDDPETVHLTEFSAFTDVDIPWSTEEQAIMDEFFALKEDMGKVLEDHRRDGVFKHGREACAMAPKTKALVEVDSEEIARWLGISQFKWIEEGEMRVDQGRWRSLSTLLALPT